MNNDKLIDELNTKLSEANARNALLVDALKDADTGFHHLGLHEISNSRSRILTAISANSANSEAVAAWEAEKQAKWNEESNSLIGMQDIQLANLRREVAMLRDALNLLHKEAEEYQFDDGLGVGILNTHWDSAMGAREHTQATAEAYEREVKTAAKREFLDWLYECGYLTETAEKIHADNLRAANKGKGIV